MDDEACQGLAERPISDAELARHVASYEGIRGKIVDLLTMYGWDVEDDDESRKLGVLCFAKDDLWFITETSGWPRLLKELEAQPSIWRPYIIEWFDWMLGPFPLPYYLTQSFEEIDMTMKLLNEKMDQVLMRLERVENSLTAIQTTGKVLAWVISILTGIGIGVIGIIWAFFDAIGWDRVLDAGRIIFT